MRHKYNTTAAYKNRFFSQFSKPEKFKSYNMNTSKKPIATGTIINT